MDQDITSEEKLLKLIRAKEGGNNPSNDIKNSNKIEKKKKPFALQFKRRKRVVDFLKVSNVILGFAIILLAVYFAKFYFLDLEKGVDVPELKAFSKKSVEKEELVEELLPFDVYEEKFLERNIFQTPWEKNKGSLVGKDVLVNKDSRVSNQLKLVGIILDESPKAIIEDLQKKETLFLSLNEKHGNVVVEDIQEDRVILKLNGEKIELKP
jgi:hypothetical protein